MSAQNYPVTQDYGYDPAYPSPDHFHKGIDYGCPMQTPVVVNGVQIGLSGNSGFVTGPHLHVGRWLGSKHTNPGVGNGFNFGEAVVAEINEDATDGKYVRIQGDGASWVYLHLYEQTCSVGQRLTPAVPQAPAPTSTGKYVILPAHVPTWAVYRVGSGLRKGTSDQVGTLLPSKFGGLSYEIISWIGNYAVVINTESFGRVTLWVKDTDAIFSDQPIASPAPAPAPAAPPEPAPAPKPPQGPLTAPSSETYEVVKEIPGYLSSNQAINHINPKVSVPIGTYFVFNRRDLAINVTKTPGSPGAWINSSDNTLAPPTPDPAIAEAEAAAKTEADKKADELAKPDFATTYKAFPRPELYVAVRDVDVTDVSGERKPTTMQKYAVTWISGSFVKDGVEYALPQSAEQRGWWYGIPWIDRPTNAVNLELESEVFNSKTTLEERQVTKTLTTKDHFTLVYGHVKHFVLGFIQILSKIKTRKTK